MDLFIGHSWGRRRRFDVPWVIYRNLVCNDLRTQNNVLSVDYGTGVYVWGVVCVMQLSNGSLCFAWQIEPVAQARPRATHFGQSIRLYDQPKVKSYKARLADMARSDYHGKPLSGPLSVEIKFYRRVQQSLSNKECLRRLKNERRPTMKPDTDNFIKSTLDALTGTLWIDDNEIVDIYAGKFYAINPRIELRITKLDNGGFRHERIN